VETVPIETVPNHVITSCLSTILYSILKCKGLEVKVMVFNTTFINISVISWQSVLLGEETRVPGENHQPAASH
jgi:hypothetical protein